jgi:hypothetical protein
MNGDTIERFMSDGFVKLPGAVAPDVIEACVALLWTEIGLDPEDQGGWNDPIRWVGGMNQQPFVDAMNAPALVDACEALAGPRRWSARTSMGSFPLRFPSDVDPGGLGWHIEGSYMPTGSETYWANVRSRDRALLALVLFTDVVDDDGPTRIRVGSHLDIPSVLLPYGEEGISISDCAADVETASTARSVVHAVGRAGDVFVCHPFVVHAAQANHGPNPRFLGQPAITAGDPYNWDRPDSECSPVEVTIKHALNQTPTPRSTDRS